MKTKEENFLNEQGWFENHKTIVISRDELIDLLVKHSGQSTHSPISQEEIEKAVDKKLKELGYDLTGDKTADFVDGWVRSYEYYTNTIVSNVPNKCAELNAGKEYTEEDMKKAEDFFYAEMADIEKRMPTLWGADDIHELYKPFLDNEKLKQHIQSLKPNT